MKRKYPDEGTKTFQMCEFLYHNGVSSAHAVKDHIRCNTTAHVYDLVDRGYAVKVGRAMIELKPHIIKFFDDGCVPPVEYQGKIIPTPTKNIFKGSGYIPTYQQCMRPEPEWVKRDSFGLSACQSSYPVTRGGGV